ncbi:2Fe-2S iron-sulfur cluster-binding protein [Breoghania sp.]|uniref:(2Fe-2S)-binding protein n=1 Tax=Breoghania sp. TaxID=2065378 RepID=UPI002AA85E21|nr:2Fe-2S iron-sulfur cluster-binding protein [Breoghania sp.]
MKLHFTLNGEPVELEAEPFTRLAPILADELGVASVRTPCGIGRCGACMVLVDGRPMNACLLVAGKVEGAEILTAEGVADAAKPVIDALERYGAVQCGYCAPGLLVSLAAAHKGTGDMKAEDVEALLTGNLCRCSGYAGLRKAIADVFA